MARTVRNGLLATASAALLLAAGAGTAQADTRQESFPGNWMMVAVMEGDDAFGPIDIESLHCPFLKGGHPDASKACRELRKAGGDINKIPHKDVACPMIYKPVTAAAYGMWDDHRKVYAKQFSNACAMHAETGSVFKLK
ncbi:SSI family serine proteinase inhibitor [Streptomyces monticola]|uniref:SSI family serine proteinase inhibitor n=1 Tax=Streptomyces monticola TaxID=2666263 RepID=A0ABW2JA58_9ACTN